MSTCSRLVVVSREGPGETVLQHAALVTAALAPDAVRVVHLMPGGSSATDEDATRERHAPLLSPELSTMLADGRLSLALRHGNALEVVLAEVQANQADLLLIGSHRAGVDRRALERRLAMTAPCSVWVAPEPAAVSLARILVPVDFSQRSADALGVAASIAAAAASLSSHALHVRFDPSRAASDDREHIVVGRERQAFATFAARVDLHDVDVEFLCEQGHDVARTILHVARTLEANLVVMGTRGRTRAASLLIGSETEHALLWSDVPVLAVKHFGARLRLLEALADARLRQRDNPQFT